MRRWRTKRSDRRAISFHYDVSNDFYALFLDKRMVYTCAYYRRPDGDLDQAQEDKLDLVGRKLRLAPGERLLDIGCGWGSLVMWAAERYGVEAHGVTLSAAQAEWAGSAIRGAGLEGRARVEHLDYRDLPAGLRFEKIAAVGVIEHIGIRNYPAYFARVHRLLQPGGLFLNHGITHEKHWRRTSQTEFFERHVFPNAELDNVSHTLDALEQARFEILDVEALRAHDQRRVHGRRAGLACAAHAADREQRRLPLARDDVESRVDAEPRGLGRGEHTLDLCRRLADDETAARRHPARRGDAVVLDSAPDLQVARPTLDARRRRRAARVEVRRRPGDEVEGRGRQQARVAQVAEDDAAAAGRAVPCD